MGTAGVILWTLAVMSVVSRIAKVLQERRERKPKPNPRRMYVMGYFDGAGNVLRAVEGRPDADGDDVACYRGPVPDELREWCAVQRSHGDQVRADMLPNRSADVL
jgi:hypothetical protein